MTDVRLAEPPDGPEVGRILAAGFADDPVLCWLFQEPARAAKHDVFFRFFAGEALVPLGATYLLPGGCAAWTPPGARPWPDERTARFVTALATVCTTHDFERLGACADALAAHRPAESHWYLGQIATEPRVRCQGVGTALLARSLEAVDADRLPAYLESSNPRNVPLYERHGFAVVGSIDLPGGPSLTPMWREPR
jgi:GNAT superfamily N-acetyltransferase